MREKHTQEYLKYVTNACIIGTCNIRYSKYEYFCVFFHLGYHTILTFLWFFLFTLATTQYLYSEYLIFLFFFAPYGYHTILTFILFFAPWLQQKAGRTHKAGIPPSVCLRVCPSFCFRFICIFFFHFLLLFSCFPVFLYSCTRTCFFSVFPLCYFTLSCTLVPPLLPLWGCSERFALVWHCFCFLQVFGVSISIFFLLCCVFAHRTTEITISAVHYWVCVPLRL